VLVAALASSLGFEFTHYPAGFIASVLFLVPGFPLIAGYSIYCNTRLLPL
jgi:hypothetical protein